MGCGVLPAGLHFGSDLANSSDTLVVCARWRSHHDCRHLPCNAAVAWLEDHEAVWQRREVPAEATHQLRMNLRTHATRGSIFGALFFIEYHSATIII